MPRKLHATLAIELPTNEFEAAELMTAVRPHWHTLTSALDAAGLAYEQTLSTAEVASAPNAGRTAACVRW